MNPDEELTGSLEDAAELIQALNELRDVLNTTSLHLKDIRANTDFATQGEGWGKAEAVLQQLLQRNG
jgi:hypothetical protein